MILVRTTIALVLGLASWLPAAAAVTTTVVDVPSRGGYVRILYLRPDAPRASIVTWPGGEGRLDLSANGTIQAPNGACGPALRNRQALADLGYSVIAVGEASDNSVYLGADMDAVVSYVKARDNVPTWVLGTSASTGSVVALAAQNAGAVGAILTSPAGFQASVAQTVRGPAVVLYHTADAGQVGGPLYNALTSAVVRHRVAFSGGSNSGCGGNHLLNGLDGPYVAEVSAFVDQHSAKIATANYQGLWWNSPAASESGWGINFAHQGDVIFATWYTYDATGKTLWLSMIAEKTPQGTYAGTLFRTTGPAFSATPFNPSVIVTNSVGSGTLAFTDASNGTFAYTLNGISQTKTITRYVFGTVPTCSFGTQPDLSLATNYQDLWWVPSGAESGWGVNFAHQGDTIFTTWFTYDVDGTPLWLSGSMARTGPGAYSGALFRTSGPAFNAVPFLPANVVVTPVGTLALTFADGNRGTFAYTVNGVSQSKQITRYVFRAPGTVCQ